MASGAVAGTAAASCNDSIEEDEVVDTVKCTICGILASPLFDRKAIQGRSLKVWLKLAGFFSLLEGRVEARFGFFTYFTVHDLKGNLEYE